MEERTMCHNYDSYGNPLYLSIDDSTQIVYLWGYQGQYPIAEIMNATYDEVKTALGGVAPESLSSAIIPNETILDDLRKNLKNSLVTTYIYQPLVGMISKTDPRGNKTTYHYDSFDRLQCIKDRNGNIVESYDYHYRNQ